MKTNKNKAICTAIGALIASVIIWSYTISGASSPQVPEVLQQTWESIRSVFVVQKDPPVEVLVEEILVEDLGKHFAKKQAVINVESEVSTASTVEAQDVAEDPPLEEVVHAAASELDEWEIGRAWSISVPSLGIRAPVLLPSMRHWSTQAWGMLEEQMQVALNHGAVAYPHSAAPGERGSLIVAGHSSPPDERAKESAYGSVFATLPNIAIGEEISIRKGGKQISYRVEKKTVVSPETTSILEQQADESMLKVITCYPVGTTRNRMVIMAKLVD